MEDKEREKVVKGMLTQTEKSCEDRGEEWFKGAIEKAKKITEKRYDRARSEKRTWLELKGKNSYCDEAYEVNLFVREGSPPKGYVFASRSINLVVAFDGQFKRIKTFDWKDLVRRRIE